MIEFREVEKRYPNGYEALRHINLTIDQGEFVAIIGLSGAGKSTLIRTINRMHDITQGQLTVDGTAGRRLFCVNPGSVQSCSLDQIYILIAGGRKPLC